MAKKTFGSRSRTPASPTAGDGSNNKYSKVDLTRGVIAALVQTYATVADAERDSLEMRIRLLQD